MEHDEIKKNCISGCAAEKKAETCGGKQNSKRKKTDVIEIAQQLKNEKKIRTTEYSFLNKHDKNN